MLNTRSMRVFRACVLRYPVETASVLAWVSERLAQREKDRKKDQSQFARDFLLTHLRLGRLGKELKAPEEFTLKEWLAKWPKTGEFKIKWIPIGPPKFPKDAAEVSDKELSVVLSRLAGFVITAGTIKKVRQSLQGKGSH